MIRIREVVHRLMQKCEGITGDMEKLTKLQGVDFDTAKGHIRKQPKTLNPK